MSTAGFADEAPLGRASEAASVESTIPDDADVLRQMVLDHLRDQGFVLTERGLLMDVPRDKDAVRQLHDHAVAERRREAARALAPIEERLVSRLLPSNSLRVEDVRPALRLIDTYKHPDAALWRWASLHWSIPVSSGYGRRLRYAVVDEGHDDALMGIIGLGDPVFALRCRDDWIGWDHERRRTALAGVMDAFVLGAVPPYAALLGTKLMALLATSTDVVADFKRKFGARTSLISERPTDGRLVLVTTTSALGRSSVYNRLTRPNGGLAYVPIGSTAGSGDFHLSGALYERLVRFAAAHTADGITHRHARWPGNSFRNRREVVMRALTELGLPDRPLRTHGIQRQVFVAPTATNTQAFLRGDHARVRWATSSAEDIASFWASRWAAPRSERMPVPTFEPRSWLLYN